MEGEGGPGIPGVSVGGVLGRGASARVLLGTQDGIGRKVALKVLDVPDSGEVAERLFHNECVTLGRLASHPNIVTLYDAGTTDEGHPYLVMEFLPAGTLADRVQRLGSIPWPEVLDIGVQLAGALETTHRHGIAHGDLKPQNVLVGRLGQPVLADFGIARLLAVSHSTAMSVFTPLHAAPELFDGQRPDSLSDVYGLASTLFTLLTGSPRSVGPGRHLSWWCAVWWPASDGRSIRMSLRRVSERRSRGPLPPTAASAPLPRSPSARRSRRCSSPRAWR